MISQMTVLLTLLLTMRSLGSSAHSINRWGRSLVPAGGVAMKRMVFVACALSSFLWAPCITAQVDTIWTRTFGGEAWDFAEEVQQTADGGFIVCGTTGADVGNVPDIYLVKTDENGVTIWTKNIGTPEARDYGNSIQETKEGGYIITGHTWLPAGPTSWDVVLVKTDSEGNPLWTRTFGGSLMDDGACVRRTDGGGYIVAGQTRSFGAGGFDVLLVKTDSLGYVEWRRTFGGLYDDTAYSVEQTADGGYIVGGYTRSLSGGGFADVYLIKTDPNGVAEWERTYGGDQEDLGFSAQQTSDGGYVIAGWTCSQGAGPDDAYLIKTGPSGELIWDEPFGGSGSDVAYSVIVSGEGREEEYVLAGCTDSFGGGDDDIYLIRANAEGILVWSWFFGGTTDESGQSVVETTDGGFVIAGNIGTSDFGGDWDVYLVRLAVETGIDVSIYPTGPTAMNRGDVLEFSSTITNYTEHFAEGDYWLSLELPDRSEVLIPDAFLSLPGFMSGQVFPNDSIELNNALWINGRIETGSYRLIARIGLFPDEVLDEDSFPFEVIE